MALTYSLAISTDLKFCRVTIDPASGLEVDLRADELEGMISNLAQMRQKMIPPVRSPDIAPSTDSGDILVDAESPRTDVALLPAAPPCVILAIGFPGLGVRSVALSLQQARLLGQKLVRASMGK